MKNERRGKTTLLVPVRSTLTAESTTLHRFVVGDEVLMGHLKSSELKQTQPMLLEWGAVVLWQNCTNHPPLQRSAHSLASSKTHRQIYTLPLCIALGCASAAALLFSTFVPALW